MGERSATRPFAHREDLALGAVVLVKLIFHLATCSRYDRMSTEYYFIALSERLDWGYVDVMPFVPAVLRASRALSGEALVAERLAPALAGAATVLLTGLSARRLGGGVLAQVLSAVAVLVAPAYLRASGVQSIKSYEPFFWALAGHVFISSFRREERGPGAGGARGWAALGLALGVGALNGPMILLFGLGCVLGLLATRARGRLAGRGPWLALVIAACFLLPTLVWQARHGWVALRYVADQGGDSFSVKKFWVWQVLALMPGGFALAMLGLAWCLRRADAAPARAIGWAYVGLAIFFTATAGKVYYLHPIYPLLLAAGGVAVERWRSAPAKGAMVLVVAALGLYMAPGALPILSMEAIDRYAAAAFPPVFRGAVRGEIQGWITAGEIRAWEVEKVSEVFSRLSAEERGRAAVLARGFPTASAIDYFAARHGLPKAISGDVSYWAWGPRGHTGEVVVAVAFEDEDLRGLFGRCEATRYPFNEKVRLSVHVCREPAAPLEAMWPELQTFGIHGMKYYNVGFTK